MNIDHAGTAGALDFLAGERSAQDEAPEGRDLFTVATCYLPIDAYILQGCLVAAGVPAVLADVNLVQANSLWTAALGGVRILVPQCHMQQAHAIIEAFERGEFTLPDDVDVGRP